MAKMGARTALAGAIALGCWPSIAAAQAATASDLLAMDNGSLRDEVASRYDAALAKVGDPVVTATDSSQFMWASQAKNQCGIALGFLKSGTKDPVSIGKCVEAHGRMMGAVAPVAVLAPDTGPPPHPCNTGPFIVFFDWDRSDITGEAAQVLDSAVAENRNCASLAMSVAGYTDRSGADAYNQALSARRAEAVRSYVVSRGVNGAAVSTEAFGETNPRVPTEDGVRELQNRRAEINFK